MTSSDCGEDEPDEAESDEDADDGAAGDTAGVVSEADR